MKSRLEEVIEAFERNPASFAYQSHIAFETLKKIIFVLDDYKPQPDRPEVHPYYVIDEIRKILELDAEENEPQVNPVPEEQATPTFTVEHILKLHEAEIINSQQARRLLGIPEEQRNES